MAQQLFILNPSDSTKETLQDIGYEFIPFTDAGIEGVLTLAPVEELTYVADAFQQLASLRLVTDHSRSEFSGIIRARALKQDEFERFKHEQNAASILERCKMMPGGAGSCTEELNRYREAIRKVSLLGTSTQENSAQDLRTKVEEEFASILDHEKVVDVSVAPDGRSFLVRTNELQCKNPKSGVIYNIGEFEILFDMTPGVQSAVSWKNLSRNPGDMPHPHIRMNGKACLGNLSGVCEGFMAEGEYFAAVDMAIRFVESVRSDLGYILEQFPRAST